MHFWLTSKSKYFLFLHLFLKLNSLGVMELPVPRHSGT